MSSDPGASVTDFPSRDADIVPPLPTLHNARYRPANEMRSFAPTRSAAHNRSKYAAIGFDTSESASGPPTHPSPPSDETSTEIASLHSPALSAGGSSLSVFNVDGLNMVIIDCAMCEPNNVPPSVV